MLLAKYLLVCFHHALLCELRMHLYISRGSIPAKLRNQMKDSFQLGMVNRLSGRLRAMKDERDAPAQRIADHHLFPGLGPQITSYDIRMPPHGFSAE